MNDSPCGTPKARAFSLFEALATIAILGILSWVIVASQSGVSQHVARTKIESDIATLNQAIRVYLANGGSLSGISSAQAVLDKLKTSISASEDAKFVGFGGTMIDPRLRARNTTNEESAASGKRAVWDATHLRFKLADSGDGIAEFLTLTAYPSGLTVGARARSTSLAYTNSASASQSIAVTPASPTSGGVAMIKTQATLDGQVFGSIQIQNPSTVNINSSTKVSGDINLPGTPKVTINGKPNFSGVAVGTGSTSPAGYAVFVNEGATFGVLRTRVDSPAMPSVNPPPATSGPWITVDSPAQVPASWFPNSGVNLNPNAGSITLPPGNYGALNASNYANGGKLLLGNANGKPATYNFYSFTLNSGVPVQILGPVTINTREFAINAGSTLGSTGSQTLLTINVSGSQFIDNSSAKVYAKLILVPNGTLTVNGEVHTGVMTQNLNVTGSGRLYVGQ